MMTQEKWKKITSVLFAIYLIALGWIILFKMQTSFTDLPQLRSVKLIPFVRDGRQSSEQFVLNFLSFIPFGIYLSMLRPKKSFAKNVMLLFLASFLIEVLQYVFAIGVSDIDDVIANTFGGVIGIFGFVILEKCLKDKTAKVLTLTALGVTIIALASISMLSQFVASII